ncbi:hypothetical protein HPB47_017141 [Ixodes persulcatus]|uniref:Uncharacterized protein n=1 Tax=Ixodes persulcatus TaxID=34615 RepID=A0AC60QR35_IXOPE|nr:hypothetical protein HPB47_017141 [Ixodes persulcatus]
MDGARVWRRQGHHVVLKPLAQDAAPGGGTSGIDATPSNGANLKSEGRCRAQLRMYGAPDMDGAIVFGGGKAITSCSSRWLKMQHPAAEHLGSTQHRATAQTSSHSVESHGSPNKLTEARYVISFNSALRMRNEAARPAAPPGWPGRR